GGVNMDRLKVGFIVCASHKDGIKDPNGNEYVDSSLIADCQNQLKELGIDCIKYPIVVANKKEAKEAFMSFAKNDEVQSIIIFPGTWNWVGNLTAAIRQFGFG